MDVKWTADKTWHEKSIFVWKTYQIYELIKAFTSYTRNKLCRSSGICRYQVTNSDARTDKVHGKRLLSNIYSYKFIILVILMKIYLISSSYRRKYMGSDPIEQSFQLIGLLIPSKAFTNLKMFYLNGKNLLSAMGVSFRYVWKIF